jgi:hypothetical protein
VIAIFCCFSATIILHNFGFYSKSALKESFVFSEDQTLSPSFINNPSSFLPSYLFYLSFLFYAIMSLRRVRSLRRNIGALLTSPLVNRSGRPFEEFYELGDELGKGSQSEVRVVTHLENGTKAAVKVCFTQNFTHTLLFIFASSFLFFFLFSLPQDT